MAKILYVEDDLSLSFVTRDQLEKRGYEVFSCENGLDALALFKKEIFDLCIFDVMLPKMDGFELAKNIRETNKQIPIIFLTARSKAITNHRHRHAERQRSCQPAACVHRSDKVGRACHSAQNRVAQAERRTNATWHFFCAL